MNDGAQRTRRVIAILSTPVIAEVVPSPEPGGLPQDFLGFYPIIDGPITVSVDDVNFLISPFGLDEEWKRAGIRYAPLLAMTDLLTKETDTLADCTEFIEHVLDAAVDQLSFGWTYPVSVRQLEIIDLTEPISVGDERETWIYPVYSSPKEQSTKFLGGAPNLLGPDYSGMSEKQRAALRWYSIGLSVQADVQRYMAFWIALEILVREATDSVQRPYKAPCGHTIEACPACERPTTRNVGGEQIKGFLVDDCGLTEVQARDLWGARQMMHGSNKLTPKSLKEIPQHVSTLWGVLVAALAKSAGYPMSAPWLPGPGVGNMAIRGSRKVTERDLDPTRRTFDPFVGKSLIRIETPPHDNAIPSGRSEIG
jgi:hypothetical protein